MGRWKIQTDVDAGVAAKFRLQLLKFVPFTRVTERPRRSRAQSSASAVMT
jgi:hypothetical protein